MNTLVIVLIAAVCLFGAYTLYGRWLANKWGIDPTAKTPAVVHEDGRDYVPTNGWTVFAHQFSSIAGAGPVTGAIQAAAFGWLLAGGIIYTVGGIIYALKLPLFNARHQYFGSHEIFHLFVMGGSFCHFIFMYQYVIGLSLSLIHI